MSTLNEYLDRAKNLAADAGELAKNAVGETVDRAKDLVDEGSKVREMAKNAKEQTASYSLSAKEKVQGIIKDAKAGTEIKLGIDELETMKEEDGSIIYKMELETIINSLNKVYLIIKDNRLDDESVREEIRKVMEKVQPAGESQEDAADEQQAIEKAKAIAYNACSRALESIV